MEILKANVVDPPNYQLSEDELKELAKLGQILFSAFKDTANRVKVAGVNLLIALFEKQSAHQEKSIKEETETPGVEVFQPDALYNAIFGILSGTAMPQPTLKGAAYLLLGAICKHFPKQTSKKHGQEARIKSALMSELRIQVESTAQKLDLSVVEGCLKGNFNTGQ